MYSNDPRFIFKAIRSFGGFCYYANHYEKIIRDGCFLSVSRCLNGPDRLINYNDRKILITIGTFVEDVPKYPIYGYCIRVPFLSNLRCGIRKSEKITTRLTIVTLCKKIIHPYNFHRLVTQLN